MKSLGGENFAKGFDKFIGLVDNALFLTTVLAGSMALEALSGDDGGGLVDTGVDMVKDRLLQKGAAKAATSAAGKAGGLGVGAVAAIVAGAGLLSSALGEGAFQVRKFAVKPIQKLENDQKSDKNPFTKIGRGVVLNMVRPLFGVFQAVGFLLDVVGAPFRYAIELLRFPFLSEEDKKKQATNLAKFDARIREDLRRALNFVTLGLAFKEKGSFGNIYGDKNAQKDMMSKMAGGGVTRGGKAQGRTKRTIGGTTKYKKTLAQKPTQTRFKTTDKKVKEVSENLDKTQYFGPVLSVAAKVMQDEKPDKKDYENAGLGLNLLIAKGIEDGQLKGGLVAAFAEGGMVDDEFLSAAEKGSDISNWIASTFNRLFESKVEQNLRLIKERQEQGGKVEGGASSGDDSGGTGGGIMMGTSFENSLAKLLKSYEGLRTAAYKDAVGIPTIGMGATYYPKGFRLSGRVQMGQTITEDEAVFIKMQHIKEHRVRLLRDISASEYAKVPDNVKAALESKTFNYGSLGSTLAGLVKEGIKTGNYKSVADYFRNTLSRHDGGINDWRRNDEAGLIETGVSKRAKVSFPKSAGGQAIAEYQEKGGKSTDSGGSFVGGGTGAGHGSEGGKIAGKLGDFMKTNKGQIGVTGSIHQHPRHPPLRQRSYKSYHNEGRALDIGGYSPSSQRGGYGNGTDEQAPVIRALLKWNQQNNYKPVELIHGSPAFRNLGDYREYPDIHHHHVHVAYAKGGRVRKLTRAILGEKGPEFVFDADTTAGLDRLAPQLLERLNMAKTKPQLASILQMYTDYEQQGTEFIEVPVEVPVPMPMGGEGGGGFAIALGGGEGGDDFASGLYKGG